MAARSTLTKVGKLLAFLGALLSLLFAVQRLFNFSFITDQTYLLIYFGSNPFYTNLMLIVFAILIIWFIYKDDASKDLLLLGAGVFILAILTGNGLTILGGLLIIVDHFLK